MNWQSKLATMVTLLLAVLSGAAVAQDGKSAPPRAAAGGGLTMLFGSASYLGVRTEDITSENAAKYNLSEPRGVGIVKVIENSPAAKAGLREGDVILKFEGESVKGTRKLTRLIEEVAPDQKASLLILRGGAEQEIVVTIGKRETQSIFRQYGAPNGGFEIVPPTGFPRFPLPDGNFEMRRLPSEKGIEAYVWSGTGRRLGVSVTPLTRQLADYFGVADGKGLLIEEVREASPAAKAGLQAGDIILEVDGASVATQSELTRALNKKSEGEVAVTILREKQRQIVRVTPESAKLQPVEKF
jgi:serine protease Do